MQYMIRENNEILHRRYTAFHSLTGRLSKEDIEQMVQEAEQFRAEDEAQRDKVTAKNSLESLAFNMKSTVEDEKLQDKISPEDKKTIVDKCNEVISWLDKNQVKILFTDPMNLDRSHRFLFGSHCESREVHWMM